METKHTKGKFKDGSIGWKVDNRETNGVKGFEIHWSDDGECITDHVYTKADAKLIAAAPIMLSALNDLKHLINSNSNKSTMIELIDSVIKKATE